MKTNGFRTKLLCAVHVNCVNLSKYINYSALVLDENFTRRLLNSGMLISNSFIIDKNKSFQFKMMNAS